MAHYLRNLKQVSKVDCSCGWSRRPFADHPAYAIASLHGTIFTAEKEAFPHFHVPVGDRRATHETYLVTSENTRRGALIYLGKMAVEAKPGIVVYVHPNTVHGGIGNFTALILGSPGFSKEGNVEIDDTESKDTIILRSKGNIITPSEYKEGLVLLTAKKPTLSFSHFYGKEGIALLLTQTVENRLYCAAVPYDRLDWDAFQRANGPTYVTVLGGEGSIHIEGGETAVRELDTLLLEQGTSFSLEGGLSTAIMVLHPQNVEKLIRH